MEFPFTDSCSEVNDEAVECMCGMVQIYLKDLLGDAAKVANVKGVFDEECFLFAMKSELDKFKRSKELVGRKLAIDKELYMDF